MGRRPRSYSRSRSHDRGRSRSRSLSHHRSRSRSRSASVSRERSSHSRHHSHSSRRRTKDKKAHNVASVHQEKAEAANDGVIKAKTVEKDGEISCSIEETNRLRAALGLKPLNLAPKKDKVVNLQKTSAQIEAEQQRASVEDALRRSKQKRELSKKLSGKSLGESLQEVMPTSALDWVKQSRSKAVTSLSSTTETEPRDASSAYSAEALAGMTVGHDVSTFQEGEEVVLTLKDTTVLDTSGQDLNDQDDELVNVEMSQLEKHQEQKDRAKRALMPSYMGYDDEEFIIGALKPKQAKPRKRLLAQYDDEEDRQRAKDSRRFTLDASGNVTTDTNVAVGTAAKPSSNEDQDDEVVSVSLAPTQRKVLDDYYTKDEVEAQFASKKTKKLRKKKKLRKRRDVEEAEVDQHTKHSSNGKSLVEQLEEEAIAASTQLQQNDRGRRKRSRYTEQEDEQETNQLRDQESENRMRFELARRKANDEASSAFQRQTGRQRIQKHANIELDDEADIELSQMVASSRRIAQLKANALAPNSLLNEERVAMLVAKSAEGEQDAKGNQVMAEDDFNVVVFNEATDFETRLRDAMERRKNAHLAASKTPVLSSATRRDNKKKTFDVNMEDEGSDMDMEPEGKGSDDQAQEESKTKGDKDETSGETETWGEQQPLVGSGMAATLALLRNTGDLREQQVEKQAGRANDARDRNIEDELRVKEGVKLDYRDEFGRLLTKKEAFRLLSYRFHGHEPGKKKKEKRLKQLQAELQAQKMLSGEGSSKMMKVLEKKQKVAQQAHVVLSGGNTTG